MLCKNIDTIWQDKIVIKLILSFIKHRCKTRWTCRRMCPKHYMQIALSVPFTFLHYYNSCLICRELDLTVWILTYRDRSIKRFSSQLCTYEHAIYDDVIKWKHFPSYWSFVWGIHRWSVNYPHKGQWRGALMFSLIYAWTNGWANNRYAGGLRHHHVHYDVIVMKKSVRRLMLVNSKLITRDTRPISLITIFVFFSFLVYLFSR